MKPILMILGLVLAAGAGAVGGIVAAPRAVRPSPEIVTPALSTAPSPTGMSPEVEKRLQSLSLELSALETQIASLKSEPTRAPATPERSTPSDKLATAETTAAFAALHRDAILKVIADERAEQDRKREEERKQRELQAFEARADRAAEKFTLSAAQRQTLVDYYVAERTHFEEIRAQFREAQDGAPESVRDAFREGREWRTNELTKLFGTDLGAQLGEFENESLRRGMAVGGQRRGGGNGGGANAGAGGGNGAGATPVRAGGGR